MYLRPLRTIFNEAIEEGIIKKEIYYLFGRRKYRIPAAKNTKKALELSDVKKIYYYQCDPKNISQPRAKGFWLFSYFGNGMNPKDIACLQYKNVQNGYINFERSKTERALRSDPKPIIVFITDDVQAIIDRWGNKDRSPKTYIFPIMEHRILKCHVLIDLKIDEFDHGDAGQMNMYLNYYNENELAVGDNALIGIILCSGKNKALVKYATMGLPQQVFVSRYMVNLPSENELKEIIVDKIAK